MNKFLIVLSVVVCIMACQHKHEHSVELKEAYKIQQEGLKEIKELYKKLDGVTSEKRSKISTELSNLEKQMIEIEGMDHNHTNCSHGHKKSQLTLTDLQMLTVQKEWRDSIFALETKMFN